MNTIEFVLNTFQKILGDQYALYPNHTFQKRFLNPLVTPYGTQYDVKYQAFDEYADKIVGVLECTPTDQISTPYYLSNATYNLSFWVPVDALPLEQTEVPKFTFYTDMENLSASVRNREFRENGLKAFFSISEPRLVSAQADRAGCFRRVVMQITGNVTVSDESVGMGSDIEVTLTIDGTEYPFVNITNFMTASTTGSNANQYSDTAKTELQTATIDHSISFVVDDWGEEDNKAIALVRDKAFRAVEKISPGASGEEKQREVSVAVYKVVRTRNADGSTSVSQKKLKAFQGILEAQYAVAGKTGFGKYSVTIHDTQGDG